MRQKERALIDALKKESPLGISVLNRARGYYVATGYYYKFSDLAAELLRVYIKNEYSNPIYALSSTFMANGITTCRGADMSYERAKYFYQKELASRIKENPNYQFPTSFGKEECPMCGKFLIGLAQHLELCGNKQG